MFRPARTVMEEDNPAPNATGEIAPRSRANREIKRERGGVRWHTSETRESKCDTQEPSGRNRAPDANQSELLTNQRVPLVNFECQRNRRNKYS
ncbi:hypothetical protein IID10_05075 [candidate division KSB1 bacterium]|nr:hypothetical protein [candidate division KSB1 bacterium]